MLQPDIINATRRIVEQFVIKTRITVFCPVGAVLLRTQATFVVKKQFQTSTKGGECYY